MENDLIESLLFQHAVPLSTLLNDRFNEHIELTYLSSAYVIHFLMGISTMLMSDDVRSEYGVQRVFFTSFKDQKIVRLVILMEKKSIDGKNTEKSMKVRSFDIGGKGTVEKQILSAKEYKVMKLLLAGEVGDLPEDFAKKVETLYHNEPNLEKINLDEYGIDYALHTMKRMENHRVDKFDTKTRVRLDVIEDFDDAKLKNLLPNINKKANPKLLVTSESDTLEFTNPENKMILFTDKKIIMHDGSRNFDPNALSDFYREYFHAQGQGSLDKFALFFTGQDGLADVYRKISFMRGIAAECGFAHGSLFILSYSYPSYVEVRQEISTTLYSPGVEQIQEPYAEMSLVYRPKFTGTEHSLNQIPIVVLFPQNYGVLSKARSQVPLAMSMKREIGIMCVKLRLDEVTGTRIINLEKRPDFVDLLFKWIQDQLMIPDLLADLVKKSFDNVRPPSRTYKFSEKNYFSRYLAGWIASSENKESISHVLLRKTGDDGSTRFLITSTRKDEETPNVKERSQQSVKAKEKPRPPTHVMLVVKEEPMSDMHYPDALNFEEPYERYDRLQEEDTLILNIRQEYVHSKGDILDTTVEEDFTRFVVRVSFAKSQDLLDAHAIFPLPRMPLSTLESANADQEVRLAKFLQLGTYFATDQDDYEAFIDGIFLNGECLKSRGKEKSIHSDLYYIRPSKLEGETMKMNFKKFSTDITTVKLIELAKSASEEFDSKIRNGPLFQVVLYIKSNELNVQLFTKEQLSICANTRMSRSLPEKCDIHADFSGSEDQTHEDKNSIDRILTPRAYKHLTKILKISNYMILGFMVRDIISDAYHKQYWNLATDLGVLLASAFSPTIGTMVNALGDNLIKAGSRFSGYTLRALGFGIKRAIFLYVFSDFLRNAISYAHDVNDTDARLGMSIDGAFLTIDSLTMAAEALGASAAFGFVGEIAAAIFIVGQNVYQTIKRVQQIEDIVSLNSGEIIDESLGAFFRVNIAEYVQELMSEKQLNSKLAKEAVDYLNSQETIDTYITASAFSDGKTLSIHGDTMIDMRNSFQTQVSRTSPGIDASENLKMACYVHVEQIEIEHEPGFWEKVTGFFWKITQVIRSLDLLAHGNYTSALTTAFECGDCIMKNTPICYNAFGISKPGGQNKNKAAMFKLGNRSDHVFGYSKKPNIFLMPGGVKNLTGGDKNDAFIIGTGPITGLLDGQAGDDTLDLSSFTPDELTVQKGL